MKIISWNVNGIRSVYKKGFIDWLSTEDPDILCLQEIKNNEIPSLGDLFSGNTISKYGIYLNSAGKKGYSGVSVLTKQKPQKVNNTLGLERFDEEGRFIEMEFPDFSLINLYIPHGARDKRSLPYKLNVYEYFKNYFLSNKNKPLIMCGDFNVAHEERDLARPKGNLNNIMFTREERSAFGGLLKTGFVDTFRKFNSEGGNYSWWPYRKGLRENNVGWRIDYVLVSQDLEKNLQDAFILSQVRGSDHCPVGINVNL